MILQTIYIPTLGRVNSQITYDNMPEFIKEMTYLVIQPHEEEIFRKLYPTAKLKVLPNEIKGIATTRKWIVNDAGDLCYAMFDDDLKFIKRNINRQTRKKNKDKSSEPFTDAIWREMIEKVNEWFEDGVGVGGFNYSGPPPKDTDEFQFGNFAQVYFINGSKIYRNELDWSIPWLEDTHFVLQCLKRGVKTRISDVYLHKCEKYWAEGGCKLEGRTVDKEIECYRMLERAHPHIFTIRWQETRTPVGQPSIILPKFSIKWKRAYNPNYVSEHINSFF